MKKPGKGRAPKTDGVATTKRTLAAAQQVAQEARAAKAELATRGEALVAKALALTERIARDFWDLGAVLRAMREEEVHRALHLPSFEALITTRLGLKKTTAYKLIAVATQVPRTQAMKLGVEKAYALTKYVAATADEDTARGLAAADERIGRRPLSRTSVKELREATRAQKPKRPPTLAERAQDRADRELLAQMTAHLGNAGIPKAAVTLVGDRIQVLLTRTQATRALAKGRN